MYKKCFLFIDISKHLVETKGDTNEDKMPTIWTFFRRGKKKESFFLFQINVMTFGVQFGTNVDIQLVQSIAAFAVTELNLL